MRIHGFVMALALAAACQSADVDSGGNAPDTSPTGSAAVATDSAPTAANGAAGNASPDATPPLTPEGWGPLRIGMTRAEVVAAAGEDANPGAVGGAEPEQCDEFRPEQAPEGMLLMLEQGRLTRITLSEGTDVVTEEGFGVGASADSVEAAYGSRATVTPHKYLDAPGAYITVWQTKPEEGEARGIVYEIGLDGRVEHVHAGGASIQYVEGCL